jgi:hypothetical protein
MTEKTIVILANSVKKGGRCLAGKELITREGVRHVGNWIRPVPDPRGSEVSVTRMMRSWGREPRLLEILTIPFDAAAALPDQPENWVISSQQPWRLLGQFSWKDHEELLDHPKKLWDDANSGLRSVKEGYVQRMSNPSSLYLIRPEEMTRTEVWTDAPYEPGRSCRHRRRMHVMYGGYEHEFDITDPVFAQKYYPKYPAVGDAPLNIQVPANTILCLSLAPIFRTRHYKLIAGVLES